MKKIKIILFSRFLKIEEDWVFKRREVCKHCTYNTLNLEKLSLKQKILKYFSDLYSSITGNRDEDNLGNCSACEMCSIFYKTQTEVEKCPQKKWIK